MPEVLEQVDRLERLLAGLGLDLRGSHHRGFSRDVICQIIDQHAGLPDGIEIPQDLIDWHSWQNGGKDPSFIQASENLVQGFAPWYCGPLPLEIGFEAFVRDNMRTGDDIIVPLLGMPNNLYAYRLAANGRWHISLFELEDMYWTTPEDPTRTGSEPLGQERVLSPSGSPNSTTPSKKAGSSERQITTVRLRPISI
jgi:hypothetical protein